MVPQWCYPFPSDGHYTLPIDGCWITDRWALGGNGGAVRADGLANLRPDESREFRSSAMRILIGVLSVVLSLVFLAIGGMKIFNTP